MNSVTYIIHSEDVDYCVLIDCGEYETLEPVLSKINKRVKAVLLTHGHSDHIYGLKELLKRQPDIEVYTTEYGALELSSPKKNISFFHETPFTIDGCRLVLAIDGQTLQFDGLADIEVMRTPGHDESCVTYKIGKNLFTGDAYIPGIKVFTGFPGADKEKASFYADKLAAMEADGYIIHCGHHSFK